MDARIPTQSQARARARRDQGARDDEPHDRDHEDHTAHGQDCAATQTGQPTHVAEIIKTPAGEQCEAQQDVDQQPFVVGGAEAREARDDPENRRDTDDHAHAERRKHDDRDPFRGAPHDQRRRGQHQRRRAGVPAPDLHERLEVDLRRPAPVVVQEQRSQVLARPVPGGGVGAAREVARMQHELGERHEGDGGQPGANHTRGRERNRRPDQRGGRGTRSATSEQRPEHEPHARHEHEVKARLGVSAEELQPEHAREPARGQRSRPADHELDQRQRPRDQRVDARQRPRQPHDEERPEREHDPAQQRPSEAHPEQPCQNKSPKRRQEQLQSRHHRERFPERQHVGRDAERREHRGLPVGQERATRRHKRIPQRNRRKPRAGVLQERLEHVRRVGQLEVGAEPADICWLRACPGS